MEKSTKARRCRFCGRVIRLNNKSMVCSICQMRGKKPNTDIEHHIPFDKAKFKERFGRKK